MNTSATVRRAGSGNSIEARWAAWGSAVAGGTGLVIGAIIGLAVHPATAWFAAFELGVPAAVVGLACGSLAGVIVAAFARWRAGR